MQQKIKLKGMERALKDIGKEKDFSLCIRSLQNNMVEWFLI
jgi:hypothetical protein